MISGVKTEAQKHRTSVYTPIGNFLFLSMTKQEMEETKFDEEILILESLEKFCSSGKEPTFAEHSIDHYNRRVNTWGTPLFNSRNQVVKELNRFKPLIQKAELVKNKSADGDSAILQLQVTGTNLFGILLDKCSFDLRCQFRPKKEKVKQLTNFNR